MFEKYKKTIDTLARDYFPNKQDAEDASQEVCIKLLDIVPPTGEDSNEEAWMYVVISNALKDEYRKWKTRNKQPATLSSDLVDEHSPFDYAAEQERLMFLQESFDGLPAEIREACLLRYHEQMSYEDIAKLQGVPPGTVGSRLARGKEMLSLGS